MPGSFCLKSAERAGRVLRGPDEHFKGCLGVRTNLCDTNEVLFEGMAFFGIIERVIFLTTIQECVRSHPFRSANRLGLKKPTQSRTI